MNSYAGFWIRTKAFVLDYLIILVYLIVLTVIFLLIDQASDISRSLFASRISAQISGFLLVTVPISLYFAIGESSVHRGTWGKRRLHLAVTDQNGNRVGFPRAVIRTLSKFIPWELSHTIIWQTYFYPETSSVFILYGFALVYFLIGLSAASLVFTRSHQAVYDFIAGTFVVVGNEV